MEIKQRLANIARFTSMIMFIGSLLFFYAYVSDTIDRAISHDFFVLRLPKSLLFYSLLGLFFVFNVIMNIAIGMYRESRSSEGNPRLLRSEYFIELMVFWTMLFTAGFNFLLATLLLFIAFVRIEELVGVSWHFIIPAIGMIAFCITVVGLLFTVFAKRED